MNILYVANIRIPTEKAHGIAIMKACEAFALAGTSVTLVVPRRFGGSAIHESYGMPETFRVVRLPTLDLSGFFGIPGRLPFYIQNVTFFASLFVYLAFRSRRDVIYSRNVSVTLARLLGFRVFFECHLIPRRRSAFFWLVRRAAGIIVISRGILNILTGAGIEERRIIVESSAVDLGIFDINVSREDARRELGLPQDGYLAVYTGNFTTFDEDKGIADILRALALLDGVRFIAVGGSGKDINRYDTLAHELGVQAKISLVGHAPQAKLALYQKAADVLLMPFPDLPHYRNHMSPVKMFEYMAAKRPIIASDLPTIREVLDEHTAMIVSPNEPSAIAASITLLRANPVRASGIVATAYEKVCTRYTWQKRTERVLDHIRA